MAIADMVGFARGHKDKETVVPTEKFSDAAQDFYALKDGPVRTQYYWDSTREFLGDPYEQPQAYAAMICEFLTAHQHPLTKLWSIIPCHMSVKKDPANKANEQALNPKTISVHQEIETGLSFIEMLKTLNAYEQVRDNQSVTVEMPENYDAPEYFKDFGKKEGIVFDVETGMPSPLSVHSLPIVQGDFDIADVAEAQKASKARAQKELENKARSYIDQFAAQYSPQGGVDVMKPLIDTVSDVASFERYAEAYDTALAVIREITKEGALYRIVGSWDYTDKIDFQKKFRKAFSSLQACRGKVSLTDGVNMAEQELDTHLNALELSYEIVVAQVKYCNMKATKEDPVSSRTEFENAMERLLQKAQSFMNDSIAQALTKAAIVENERDIESPRFADEISEELQRALEAMKQKRRQMEVATRDRVKPSF